MCLILVAISLVIIVEEKLLKMEVRLPLVWIETIQFEVLLEKCGFPSKWFSFSVPWHPREWPLITLEWTWQWDVWKETGLGWMGDVGMLWGLRWEPLRPVVPGSPSFSQGTIWHPARTPCGLTWVLIVKLTATHFLYWKWDSVIMRKWDCCFTYWLNTPLFINSWL